MKSSSNLLKTWLVNRLQAMVVTVPYFWLILFFLAPFAIVLKLSFSEIEVSIPPYAPLYQWVDDIYLVIRLSIENYSILFSDSLYVNSYFSSLRIAVVSTILTLLIGYPLAYSIAKAPTKLRTILLMLIVLPFWTSFLIRIYSWIAILKKEGLLNAFLEWLGIINEPLTILGTNTAVYIGIIYSYLPFMVLPLYASLEKMDISLLEAAADLGCRPFKVFWHITIPLSAPGIIAGCFLVFIPIMGEFVIPDLLGGSETLMIGKTLWAEFFNNRDWPLASAVAVILLILLIVPIMLFQKFQNKSTN